jgi:polygalacturonase
LNKGALTKTYNYHISITGLNLQVNNVDTWMGEVYGDRGQVSFIWVKDLVIEHFRCTDLSSGQFCIQICTFEDLLINDVIIKGKKDAIHLGRGKRFRISNGIFQTADDAIALAAGDWISGNPEFGDIEDGLIENCYDLKATILEGAFAKIVPSAWVDWQPGIEVRHGDAVVSNGKIYRVLGNIDGKVYKSVTPPSFNEPSKELDGIKWLLHQTDTFHTAVVRNVTFRDIFLESVRVPFQLMCYDNNYSHSYYKGAPLPVQGEITLENIRVLNNDKRALVSISTPCDILTIRNSTLWDNGIEFRKGRDLDEYLKTNISIANCTFKGNGEFALVKNGIKGKEIFVKTTGSLETGENFSGKVEAGNGKIKVESDLTGLKK